MTYFKLKNGGLNFGHWRTLWLGLFSLLCNIIVMTSKVHHSGRCFLWSGNKILRICVNTVCSSWFWTAIVKRFHIHPWVQISYCEHRDQSAWEKCALIVITDFCKTKKSPLHKCSWASIWIWIKLFVVQFSDLSKTSVPGEADVFISTDVFLTSLSFTIYTVQFLLLCEYRTSLVKRCRLQDNVLPKLFRIYGKYTQKMM